MTGQAAFRGDSRPSRRSFLKTAAASTAALALGRSPRASAWQAAGSEESSESAKVTRLSEHLYVFHGAIQVGILCDGERALLIDCGDGGVVEALPGLGIRKVEQILLTHHHRDQACGAYPLAESGSRICVPEAEKDCFANPADYWNNDAYIWRVYRSFRPQPLTLIDPLRVDQVLVDGQELTFGPARIQVLGTPGHTNGSVSYVVDVDDRRVIFCGDLLYDEGQLWDVYSLQRGFSRGDRSIGGYHGFMGDQWRLKESLAAVKQLQPADLVPSHGRLIRDPARAVDVLVQRIDACYENYVSISALRHYFPELFTEFADRPGQMPIRPGLPVPECLRHFGTTWMLISDSGAALVMDVGSTGLVSRFQQMLDRNEIRSIEALWVTHYHFDHTDGIPLFQQTFDCPCYTDRRLAEVITQPKAWRLPCLAAEAVRVDHPLEDGHSWQWREFKLTSYFYPGQTMYHSALLVERDDLRMLFVGDSHTMSGNDDYCAHNRNLLGRDVGFQYCLSLVEKLKPTHMFNCHVNDAFRFTPDEIRFMHEALDQRERMFGELVPWEHANFGTDPSWVRCFPYTQAVQPGAQAKIDVVVTNHGRSSRSAGCRAVLPKSLGGGESAWVEAAIPARQEGSLALAVTLPGDLPAGRYVVPIDVRFGSWNLPQFTEAVLDVAAE